jgi:phosphatidylserine decarboxylase
MALISSLRIVLAPPHRAGRPFISAGAAAALAGLLLIALHETSALFWVGACFTLFCLYFFRDPERVTPARPNLAIAPADGHITSIIMAPPPAELDMGTEPRWRVAIFLSVLDVHVNRSPVAGEVTKIAYHEGLFLSANLDKASDDNERNSLAMKLPDGRTLAVVQIAGQIARRILCDARAGDVLKAGQRFGIIRFGSRTDVYLPPGITPLVEVGQTMIGGETVIADLNPVSA